jgi:hypothetical protein
MITEVTMKRTLFGKEISQKSKSEFFSATELVEAGNVFRKENGLSQFNLSQYLKNKTTIEFIDELERKYETNAISKGRGRNGKTWVHPLLFIDIALAISPKLKIEVYEWLFDHLILNRNNSGDSYKEMSSALYSKFGNKKEFPKYISQVADNIKETIGVKDWESCSSEQLEKRDKIHTAIKLFCNVLNDTDQAVRLGILEYCK